MVSALCNECRLAGYVKTTQTARLFVCRKFPISRLPVKFS